MAKFTGRVRWFTGQYSHLPAEVIFDYPCWWYESYIGHVDYQNGRVVVDIDGDIYYGEINWDTGKFEMQVPIEAFDNYYVGTGYYADYDDCTCFAAGETPVTYLVKIDGIRMRMDRIPNWQNGVDYTWRRNIDVPSSKQGPWITDYWVQWGVKVGNTEYAIVQPHFSGGQVYSSDHTYSVGDRHYVNQPNSNTYKCIKGHKVGSELSEWIPNQYPQWQPAEWSQYDYCIAWHPQTLEERFGSNRPDENLALYRLMVAGKTIDDTTEPYYDNDWELMNSTPRTYSEGARLRWNGVEYRSLYLHVRRWTPPPDDTDRWEVETTVPESGNNWQQYWQLDNDQPGVGNNWQQYWQTETVRVTDCVQPDLNGDYINIGPQNPINDYDGIGDCWENQTGLGFIRPSYGGYVISESIDTTTSDPFYYSGSLIGSYVAYSGAVGTPQVTRLTKGYTPWDKSRVCLVIYDTCCWMGWYMGGSTHYTDQNLEPGAGDALVAGDRVLMYLDWLVWSEEEETYEQWSRIYVHMGKDIWGPGDWEGWDDPLIFRHRRSNNCDIDPGTYDNDYTDSNPSWLCYGGTITIRELNDADDLL